MDSRKRRRERSVQGITLRDRAELEALFASKPSIVLSYFERAQILCLMEVTAYERLLTEQPEAAERIRFVAALMGIPERAVSEESKKLNWTPLDSEVLRAAAYERESRVMHLLMRSGKTYAYADVPVDIFAGLITADSPGGFYNAKIKGKFKAPA